MGILNQFMKETNHSSIIQICDATFSFNSSLMVHIESFQEEKKCDICDAAFSHNWHLNRHIIQSVYEGRTPFKCNDCGVPFSQKGNLNQHIANFI